MRSPAKSLIAQSYEELSSSQDCAVGAFIGLNCQKSIQMTRIVAGISFNGVE
jgi:hypothetical protein